jgi:chromosome segregation ATPase
VETEQIKARFQDLDRQIYHVDLRAQARSEESFKRLLLASGLFIGLALAVAGFYFTQSSKIFLADADKAIAKLETRVDQSGELIARVDAAYKRIAGIEAELGALRRLLETARTRPGDEMLVPSSVAALSSHLAQLEETVVSLQQSTNSTSLLELQQQVAALRMALEISPEKAIALPLIRNDLDHLETTTSRDLTDIRQNLATVETRLYAITGTGVVIAIGFLGGVFAPLLGPLITSRKQGKRRAGKDYHETPGAAEPPPAEDR